MYMPTTRVVVVVVYAVHSVFCIADFVRINDRDDTTRRRFGNDHDDDSVACQPGCGRPVSYSCLFYLFSKFFRFVGFQDEPGPGVRRFDAVIIRSVKKWYNILSYIVGPKV